MILKLSQVELAQKTVLLREDFNVPLADGNITNDARIKAALPSIKKIIEAGGKLLIMSHLGRPKGVHFQPEFSLAPIAKRLEELSGIKVNFVQSWIDGVIAKENEITLLENVRFLQGEEENSPELSKKMADLCDVFVMDAFATAHRAQASTCGVAKFAKVACAGPLLTAELDALSKALKLPKRPLLAIIGGAKVSSKLEVLQSLIEKVDSLIIGGGMANTFLAAIGCGVGQSLYEPDLLSVAVSILEKAKKINCEILLPMDVVVADELNANAHTQVVDKSAVQAHQKIGDIGPKTVAFYQQKILSANTILWNGPLGIFELTPFCSGTFEILNTIVKSQAYCLAGGGDTISAIETAKKENEIDYISTGGGAFLEFVEGKNLPGVEALER